MVKKRLHEAANDELDSSECDDPPAPAEPPKTRYSLRARKQRKVLEDFDVYSDDADEPAARAGDEYEAEEEERAPRRKRKPRAVDDDDFCPDELQVEPSVEITEGERHFEPGDVEVVPYSACHGAPAPMDADDSLIDFEDIIRADVVQKRKIDYDLEIAPSKINVKQQVKEQKRLRREDSSRKEGREAEDDSEDEVPIASLKSKYNQTRLEHVTELFSPTKVAPGAENGIETDKNGDDKEKLDGESAKMTIADIMKDFNDFIEGDSGKEDNEDDDVIVLGEVKPPIIVLDE